MLHENEMHKPELPLNFLSPVNPCTNLEKASAQLKVGKLESKKQRKFVHFLL